MNKTKTIKIFILVLTCFAFLTIDYAIAGTIKGKISVKGRRSPGDAVVYLDRVPGNWKPPEKHGIMDQKSLIFIPHVMPIIKGTTVDFLNSDDVLHNVFTPDKCADKFNLGSWNKGEIRSFTFKQEDCESVMLCNVHPEMEAWIVVLQNPFFFKTGKNGEFIIENVPAGKYTLKIWHKKLQGKPQEITVPEKGEVVADIKTKRKR